MPVPGHVKGFFNCESTPGETTGLICQSLPTIKQTCQSPSKSQMGPPTLPQHERATIPNCASVVRRSISPVITESNRRRWSERPNPGFIQLFARCVRWKTQMKKLPQATSKNRMMAGNNHRFILVEKNFPRTTLTHPCGTILISESSITFIKLSCQSGP